MTGNPLESFRKLFGAVREMFWLCESFLAPDLWESRMAGWCQVGGGVRNTIRGFEKGLADTGGWREELLPMPEIEASFLHPFSYSPLGEGGTHFWRTFLPVFGG